MRLDELLENCAGMSHAKREWRDGQRCEKLQRVRALAPGRASFTFISVEATRTSGSVLTTMIAVLEVKEPTKAEKVLLLMCMDSGWL